MRPESCKILDTYDDFLAYWKNAHFCDIDKQIELWQHSYMKKYHELLIKQVQNYEEAKMDWREIAKKVFSLIPQRLQLMQRARGNILKTCRPVCVKASERLGLDFSIGFVIYVGIGCGAGWATKYRKQPAILLGLENIAEEKWHTKNKIEGLMSHEIGHLVHMKWRNEWVVFEKAERDPLFQLYSEGFAQRCEHIILKRETWHMKPDKEWLSWCKQYKRWLAKEFLERLEKQASVNDFFGSWFNIEGRKQTGYFLGHAFIQELEKTHGFREIALLKSEKVRELGMQCLRSISK